MKSVKSTKSFYRWGTKGLERGGHSGKKQHHESSGRQRVEKMEEQHGCSAKGRVNTGGEAGIEQGGVQQRREGGHREHRERSGHEEWRREHQSLRWQPLRPGIFRPASQPLHSSLGHSAADCAQWVSSSLRLPRRALGAPTHRSCRLCEGCRGVRRICEGSAGKTVADKGQSISSG